jgi:hypothetical protein
VLTHIKAKGFCEQPPTQFAEGAEVASTIVTRANGYWQLPAVPGEYTIGLGGRCSRLVYKPLKHCILRLSVRQGLRRRCQGIDNVNAYRISARPREHVMIINVFSVSSGHSYDRLLKIMMPAVHRQSSFLVKFWINKAFVSQELKATLSILAERSIFSYPLVGYERPNWLRQQAEK